MKTKIFKATLLVVFFIASLGVLNGLFFAPSLKEQGKIVAFRGGGSLVDRNQLEASNCTAASQLEIGLHAVENTRQAVAASVAAGIDVIHLNVQRTNDDQLVVFHDWTLDCATNGSGEVRQKSFAELQVLDAGYGYTFNGGKTYPLRGKGFSITKLSDFYAIYPRHIFWLNLKNNDERSFALLSDFLSDVSSTSTTKTTVITSLKGMRWFESKAPTVSTASVDSVKSCSVAYLFVGWAGLVPDACKNTILLLPPAMATYFWGFPTRMAARLQEHGTEVYLWSQHNPIDPTYRNLVKHGVGMVTSDIAFIDGFQANKPMKSTVGALAD